ncbi:MAG: hypothetical protein ACPGVU_22120, partial [Limisphaerales bacterium]
MAKIDAFFNLMMTQKASDLHLASGNNPMLRINGELRRVDYPPLKSDDLKAMLYEIAPDVKIKHYEETGDVDFGYEIPEVARTHDDGRKPIVDHVIQRWKHCRFRCYTANDAAGNEAR